MVDAGASAVIGHHTHTFQSSMNYKGAPIYFSLGNFCFDDIVMDQQVFRMRESGRKGGILELEFSDEKEVVDTVFGFRLNGLKLESAPQLANEFSFWNRIFWWVRKMPGLYQLYYYLLKRWEPVHFHAQLSNTSMVGVAISKLKRTIGL
jgi:hypothetical protein